MLTFLKDKTFEDLEEFKEYIFTKAEQFRLILESIKAGIVVIDENEEYVYFNNEAKKQMRIDGFMEGKYLESCHSSSKYQKAKKIINSFKNGRRTSFTREANFFGKKYAIYVNPLINGIGDYLGAVRLSVDISKRKEFEEKLLNAKQKYEQLFENSGEAILVVNTDSKRIVDLNQRAIELYKYNLKVELLGKDVRELVARDLKEVDDDMGKVIDNKVYTFASKHKCKTGDILDVELNARLIDYDGEECFLYNIRDITEKVKIQRQKYKAQRLKHRNQLFKKINNLYKQFTKIEDKVQFNKFLERVLNELIKFSHSKEGIILVKDIFQGEGYLVKSTINTANQHIVSLFNDIKNNYTIDEIDTRILIKNEINENNILNEKLSTNSFRSLISKLITYDEELVGGIALLNKEKDYIDGDKEVIRTFVSYLKNGIEKIENLQRQIKEEKIKKEIDIAAQIQTSFLPEKNPQREELELATYSKAAQEVGGDYFGFNENKNQIGILISDVMGKGIPSAIMVATIHSAFNILSKFNQKPSEILTNLNNNLYNDLKDSPIFVSAFYGAFNFETKILKYSNAGHNPPIVWSAKERKIQLLRNTGILCGIEPHYSYSCNKIKLNKGDIIIFYTDGLTDVRNCDKKRFKLDGIKNLLIKNNHLPAHRLKIKLVKKIKEFSLKQTQPDDISFIICKFKG